MAAVYRGRGLAPEGAAVPAFTENLHTHLVVFQVREFGGLEFAAEFAFQGLRILFVHSKADDAADIAKDGIAQSRRELGGVLVRECETEPVLAGFGEDAGEAVSGEILELVDVQVEVWPFAFRYARTLHGSVFKL